MKQHRVLAPAIIAAVAISLTACTSDPSVVPSPPTATSENATSSSAPPVAVISNASTTYRLPADLCTIVAFNAFTDLYPRPTPNASQLSRIDQPQGIKHSRCEASIGALANGLIIGVEVNIADTPAHAQMQFESTKGADQHEQTTLKNVTGLGSAAYAYQDEVMGTVLEVLNGNLTLHLVVNKLGSSTTIPANIVDRLSTTASNVLANMPTTA